MSELNVTSLKELERYKNGDVVELPAFSPDKPFVVRLQRPSLLSLAKQGAIPNPLLPQANSLFFGSIASDRKDPDALKKTFDIIEIMCESAFLEPTYDEIKKVGIQLTDQQYLAVFNYTQEGVKALSTFHKE